MDICGQDGWTPVYAACKNGRALTMRLLLSGSEVKVDVNKENKV